MGPLTPTHPNAHFPLEVLREGPVRLLSKDLRVLAPTSSDSQDRVPVSSSLQPRSPAPVLPLPHKKQSWSPNLSFPRIRELRPPAHLPQTRQFRPPVPSPPQPRPRVPRRCKSHHPPICWSHTDPILEPSPVCVRDHGVLWPGPSPSASLDGRLGLGAQGPGWAPPGPASPSFISPQVLPRPRRSAGESLTRGCDMAEKEGESPCPGDLSSAWRPSPPSVLSSQPSAPLEPPLSGTPSWAHPHPLLKPPPPN